MNPIELADEVIKRGLVPTIPVKGRTFFLQPHRHRYWFNADLENLVAFRAQVGRICDSVKGDRQDRPLHSV